MLCSFYRRMGIRERWLALVSWVPFPNPSTTPATQSSLPISRSPDRELWESFLFHKTVSLGCITHCLLASLPPLPKLSESSTHPYHPLHSYTFSLALLYPLHPQTPTRNSVRGRMMNEQTASKTFVFVCEWVCVGVCVPVPVCVCVGGVCVCICFYMVWVCACAVVREWWPRLPEWSQWDSLLRQTGPPLKHWACVCLCVCMSWQALH